MPVFVVNVAWRSIVPWYLSLARYAGPWGHILRTAMGERPILSLLGYGYSLGRLRRERKCATRWAWKEVAAPAATAASLVFSACVNVPASHAPSALAFVAPTMILDSWDTCNR